MQQTVHVVSQTYSITSSARSRNDSEIVRPIAFAAIALMTNSEPSRLLDWEFGRLRATQNLVNQLSGAPEAVSAQSVSFDQASLRAFRKARSAMSLQSMIDVRNC
jgi:hypothetical protein